MPIKVSIVKGKGRVNCILPGFHLDEKLRPHVFVEETTEQLDNLAKRGLITIGDVSDGDVTKVLKKLSKALTAKAKKAKIAQLRKEQKTGGVSQVKDAQGVISTVVPSELTPDEVKALATAEIEALEKDDTSALDSLVGSFGIPHNFKDY